ncbi:MAG: response regulator [Candidatus Eisenbacteria bacterium]
MPVAPRNRNPDAGQRAKPPRESRTDDDQANPDRGRRGRAARRPRPQLPFRGLRRPHGQERAGGPQARPQASHDAVLLDIMLPEKDGFTVLKELRQRHRDIPVLVMTARNFEADVLKGFDAWARTTTSPSRSASRNSWRA